MPAVLLLELPAYGCGVEARDFRLRRRLRRAACTGPETFCRDAALNPLSRQPVVSRVDIVALRRGQPVRAQVRRPRIETKAPTRFRQFASSVSSISSAVPSIYVTSIRFATTPLREFAHSSMCPLLMKVAPLHAHEA